MSEDRQEAPGCGWGYRTFVGEPLEQLDGPNGYRYRCRRCGRSVSAYEAHGGRGIPL